MNVRLMGLPSEVAQVVELLRDCPQLWVIEVHGPYANRGDDERVRVYVTALRRTGVREGMS